MTDGDDKLRQRYRELPADEPPAALDAAIRAAAHRAVAPKRGAQRWAVPASLAAVLVLAVGVTLRMQQESPGIETSAPVNEYSVPSSASESSVKSVAPTAAPPPADDSARAMQQAKPAKPAEPEGRDQAIAAPQVQKLKKDQQAAREEDSRGARSDATVASTPPPPPAKEEKRAFADSVERNVASPAAAETPATPPAPPPPAVAAAPIRERQAAQSAPSAPLGRLEGATAQPTAPAAAARPAPMTIQSQSEPAQARAKAEKSADAFKESAKGPLERELDRIIALRKDGKHAEADEAIAKFRRENPDYRIPEAIWEQVKPR